MSVSVEKRDTDQAENLGADGDNTNPFEQWKTEIEGHIKLSSWIILFKIL